MQNRYILPEGYPLHRNRSLFHHHIMVRLLMNEYSVSTVLHTFRDLYPGSRSGSLSQYSDSLRTSDTTGHKPPEADPADYPFPVSRLWLPTHMYYHHDHDHFFQKYRYGLPPLFSPEAPAIPPKSDSEFPV